MIASNSPRVIAWFSCGAASAVAAKKAIEKYGSAVEVVYCNTMVSEHDDNVRFMADVENWLGVKVLRLSSDKYASVDDVFTQTHYMAGPQGARCTVEMKKVPRFKFQRADDIHVFGFTNDPKELKRIANFEFNNPDMSLLGS